ncbi:MAG: hypothetical protein F6K03_10845 [Kamptonema sp. SIO4C4]|nr:hypothetical protein [Kamptonema sp. SIO4C4]
MPPTDDSQFQQDFRENLNQVEDKLNTLKERYTQVQQDQQQLQHLQHRQKEIKRGRRQLPASHPLQEELNRIEAEIDVLQLNLESHLFDWKSLQEPFWQIVRFTGLGIILGWLLKTWAGN